MPNYVRLNNNDHETNSETSQNWVITLISNKYNYNGVPVKDTEHNYWSNQKSLYHLQHAKNQLNSSIYYWDKADFRVPGLKRSQPYLTMCIPKVTFSFLDTMYEDAKNQLNSFIHSPCDQGVATTTPDHNHPNIFSTLNFWYQHVKK